MNEAQSYELILDTLSIFKKLFKSDDEKHSRFQKYYQPIFGIIGKTLQHDYAKVVSESLRVAGNFVNVLKGQNGLIDPQFASVVQPLYVSIRQKLDKADIDQEIK